MQELIVSHNAELAHRLTLLPGACRQVHGHSAKIFLSLFGEVDYRGTVLGLDFSEVKRVFRDYIDEFYDHHLLLNEKDPLADLDLPGTSRFPGDPTTENIARWVGEWAEETWKKAKVRVVVHETAVNAASWESLTLMGLR